MIGGKLLREFYHRRPVLSKVMIGHAVVLLAVTAGGWLRLHRAPSEEIIMVRVLDFPSGWDQGAAVALSEPAVEPPRQQPQRQPTPDPTPSEPTVSEPERPRWQPRSSEEIRQQAQLRPVEQPRPTPRQAQPQPDQPASAEQIAQRIRQQVSGQNMTVDIPGSSQQPAVSQAVANRYGGAIMALLERAWQQPSATGVPSHQRRATVALSIAPDGTIQQARLIRPSGNPAMDQSVQAIFQRLRRLPPPRDYQITANPFQINVVFELD